MNSSPRSNLSFVVVSLLAATVGLSVACSADPAPSQTSQVKAAKDATEDDKDDKDDKESAPAAKDDDAAGGDANACKGKSTPETCGPCCEAQVPGIKEVYAAADACWESCEKSATDQASFDACAKQNGCEQKDADACKGANEAKCQQMDSCWKSCGVPEMQEGQQ